MTQREMETKFAQIDERNIGGIHVALYYDYETEYNGDRIETFAMFYEDSQTGFSASFEIPKAKVLDAWNHPAIFAHAAILGKPLAKVAA